MTVKKQNDLICSVTTTNRNLPSMLALRYCKDFSTFIIIAYRRIAYAETHFREALVSYVY